MKKLVSLLMLLLPMAVSAQNFGRVDIQAVMESMPEYIKAGGELQALSKQYENELTAMQDEIQRKNDEYEKNKSTMNATMQQETEATITEMIQKYQQAYQDNQQALQKAQQEKLQPLYEKVTQAIESVGKSGNYVFIVQTNTMLYTSETLTTDVTDAVKAEINKLK